MGIIILETVYERKAADDKKDCLLLINNSASLALGFSDGRCDGGRLLMFSRLSELVKLALSSHIAIYPTHITKSKVNDVMSNLVIE
ncbi:hypothetical protein CU097_006238, partial [Rhizopus azygosporus]